MSESSTKADQGSSQQQQQQVQGNSNNNNVREATMKAREDNLRQLFEMLTWNQEKGQSSGVLLVKHMRPIFQFMGMDLRDSEIRAVMAKLDLDGNKVVDEEDFWRSMLVGYESKLDAGPSFDLPFAMFDHDTDGVIGASDYEKSNELLGKIFCAGNRAEWNQILNACALEQKRNPPPPVITPTPSDSDSPNNTLKTSSTSPLPSSSSSNTANNESQGKPVASEKKSAFTDFSRVTVNQNGEVIQLQADPKAEESVDHHNNMVITKHLFEQIVSGKLCEIEGA